jgi:hypothetical protein
MLAAKHAKTLVRKETQNLFPSCLCVFVVKNLQPSTFNLFSLPQQIHVRGVVHPLISGRRREKVPTNFESI